MKREEEADEELKTEDSYLIQRKTADAWLNVVANVDNDEWIVKREREGAHRTNTH